MSDKYIRVFRGGGWSLDPQSARVALRFFISPGNRLFALGLRLVEEAGLESIEKKEQEPASGSDRVIRGGSWLIAVQVAYRNYYPPNSRNISLGLRLVEEAGLESIEKKEQEPASGSDRVARGGCWDYPAQYARVAYRSDFPPDYRNSYLGLRLVEEVD